ncbi:hypothetical protein Noda2021_07760 [Candidatus Dependentiae bacterium Noda2021]|nr:hypothetical protein Noda2021_07760 [Candidatus Dependentiae bacterium Noda2021]
MLQDHVLACIKTLVQVLCNGVQSKQLNTVTVECLMHKIILMSLVFVSFSAMSGMEKNDNEPKSERREKKRRNSSFEKKNSQSLLSKNDEILESTRTQLFQAILNNEITVIKNKINNNPFLLTIRDSENNNTLLHFSIEQPVAMYTLTEILALYKKHTSLENVLDQTNALDRTPLMDAVHHGNLGAARLLIREGARYENANESEIRNCLHIAVIKQDELFVDEILKTCKKQALNNTNQQSDATSALSILVSKDYKGRTPLSLAVNSYNEKIFEKLLSPESIEEPDTKNEWRPLHWAAYLCNPLAVKNLLKNGASNAQDIIGQRPLHLAAASASRGSLKCVKLLLSAFKETEVPDTHKRTPLMHAAMNLNRSVFKFLKEKKANLLVEDTDKKTILHYLAAAEGATEFIKYFLEKKSVKNNNILETGDKFGRTPLFAAISNFNNFDLLAEKYRADITIVDNERNSLLHVACEQNKPIIIEYILLRAQKIIDWPNDDGKTPLIIATQLNYIDCIKKLKEYGANPHKKDIHGWSAIGWAATNKEPESLRILVPNPQEIPVHEVENAIEIAEKSNNTNVTIYLKTFAPNEASSEHDIEKKSNQSSSEANEKELIL